MQKKVKNLEELNENGITLVALVVTIIVLLILAGVSLSLVLGDNGIITRAQDAITKYKEAEAKEQWQMNNFTNEYENVYDFMWDMQNQGYSVGFDGNAVLAYDYKSNNLYRFTNSCDLINVEKIAPLSTESFIESEDALLWSEDFLSQNCYYDSNWSWNENKKICVFPESISQIPCLLAEDGWVLNRSVPLNTSLIILPNSISRIREKSFEGVEGLSSVLLGSSLQRIEECAFHRCDIEGVVIPPTVKFIGGHGFADNIGSHIVIGSTLLNVPFECFSGIDDVKNIVILDNSGYIRFGCECILLYGK